MARIAIVTGATGGIGREFVREISTNAAYADIDEIWAVGRNKDKLESLRADCAKVVAVEADFTADAAGVIARRLKEAGPDLRLLIIMLEPPIWDCSSRWEPHRPKQCARSTAQPSPRLRRHRFRICTRGRES